MRFNIISLQRLRMVALMTESKSGKLTLDCKILSTPTPLPSSRRVEVFSNPLG